MDEKLDMTRKCALTAQKVNHLMGCIPRSVASRVREGILPLCSTLVRPSPGSPACSSGALSTGRHGPIEVGPEEATKMIQGLEHFSCKGRLRELGLFSLEKRRLWGHLIAAFQYLKGA